MKRLMTTANPAYSAALRLLRLLTVAICLLLAAAWTLTQAAFCLDWFLTADSAAAGWSGWDWVEILVLLPLIVVPLLVVGLFLVARAGWRSIVAWVCAVAAGIGLEAVNAWAGQLTPSPSPWVWFALSVGYLAAGGSMAVFLIRAQRLARRVLRNGDTAQS
jgi:hypothetical protein